MRRSNGRRKHDPTPGPSPQGRGAPGPTSQGRGAPGPTSQGRGATGPTSQGRGAPGPIPKGRGGVPRYMTTDAYAWKRLKVFARENRQHQTRAEELLWQRLRNRQLGVRFRRQHAIGDFIVDFVCIEKKLVVEVDGEIHFRQKAQDDVRTGLIMSRGFRVIRFWNDEVIQDIDAVVSRIRKALNPSPLPFGEGPGVGS